VHGVAGLELVHCFPCLHYAAGAVHAEDERVHMRHAALEETLGDPHVDRVHRRRRQFDQDFS
jgi:hypothetical protein